MDITRTKAFPRKRRKLKARCVGCWMCPAVPPQITSMLELLYTFVEGNLSSTA